MNSFCVSQTGFSQGCTIGCSKCDNHTQHTFGKPLCADGIEPTVNSPRLRTMNIENAAGSVNDSYRYNPWRAPGSAPVNDPCGMAGWDLQVLISPVHVAAGALESYRIVYGDMQTAA